MHTTETLTSALAAKYAIERRIGEGGMATVYLARDLRHNRLVAIKVLRPELQAVIGAERFLAEIEVTANLRHPNLLPLFDSGEADGALYYVMPFIEGESLRARLARQRELPVEEAVRIAVAAARALDYAHRRGVIHRDLKPENVLLEDSQPLIADFGIALAVSKAGGERITQSGISLGTPQYMSPEQATGDRELDGRSDIYSLGAVLYEMLTGAPPHTGPTVQAVIASIVTQDARAVSQLRKTVPVHVEAALERALAKVPADRFTTAGEFATALEDPSALPAPITRRMATRPRFAWQLAAAGVAAGIFFGAGVVSWWLARGDRTRSGADRSVQTISLARDAPLALTTEIPTVGYNSPVVALSPGGTWLTYVAKTRSGRMLYLRDMASGVTRQLPGTEGVIHAFFSPDGQEIGFVTTDRVKKASLRSGSVMTLCEARTPVFGWWPRPDVIYFGEAEQSQLSRVRATGGIAERDLTSGILALGSFSDVLPDGRALAVKGSGISRDSREIVLVNPATREATPLKQFGYAARYVPPGYLLFVRGGSLMAIRFDIATAETVGEPVQAASGVVGESLFGVAHVAIAATGIVAFVPGGDLSLGKLAWVDRRGRVSYVDAPEQVYGVVDLSPDDVRIAVHVADVKDYIMIWDTRRAEGRRIASDSAEGWPQWHPRGSALATTTRDSATWAVQVRTVRAGSIGPPVRVHDADRAFDHAWGPTGEVLALARSSGTQRAIEVIEVRTGARLGATIHGYFPSFSPDGRWLAHVSDRTGKVDVFISSVADGRAVGQVSANGGIEPIWKPSGDLFYRDGNRWYVTRVTTDPEPRWAPPALAFEIEFNDTPGLSYDVSSDGQRLLVVKRAASVAQSRIEIIRNWMEVVEQAR